MPNIAAKIIISEIPKIDSSAVVKKKNSIKPISLSLNSPGKKAERVGNLEFKLKENKNNANRNKLRNICLLVFIFLKIFSFITQIMFIDKNNKDFFKIQ